MKNLATPARQRRPRWPPACRVDLPQLLGRVGLDRERREDPGDEVAAGLELGQQLQGRERPVHRVGARSARPRPGDAGAPRTARSSCSGVVRGIASRTRSMAAFSRSSPVGRPSTQTTSACSANSRGPSTPASSSALEEASIVCKSMNVTAAGAPPTASSITDGADPGLLEHVVVKAPACTHSPGAHLRPFGGQRAEHVVERVRVEQVGTARADRALERVHVAVDQPGHGGGPTQVDDLGPRAAQLLGPRRRCRRRRSRRRRSATAVAVRLRGIQRAHAPVDEREIDLRSSTAPWSWCRARGPAAARAGFHPASRAPRRAAAACRGPEDRRGLGRSARARRPARDA